MARPLQTGLNYFPLDVTFDQDDKIALIESDFGLEGFSITIKLLMKIYSESYFYHWGEKEQKIFARKVGMDVSLVVAIVDAGLRWGLFSQLLFDDYGILSSRGIQKRYFEAVSRRKDVPVTEEYILLSEQELEKYLNLHIVSFHQENTDVNIDDVSDELMSTLIPQSKEKESRVEKSKSSRETKKETSKTDDDLNTLLNAYKDKIETPSKQIEKQLNTYLADFDPSVILEAINRTQKNRKRFSYLSAILADFKRKNVKTVKDLAAYDRSFKQRQQFFSKPVQKNGFLPEWATFDYEGEDEAVDEETDQAFRDKLERIRKKG